MCCQLAAGTSTTQQTRVESCALQTQGRPFISVNIWNSSAVFKCFQIVSVVHYSINRLINEPCILHYIIRIIQKHFQQLLSAGYSADFEHFLHYYYFLLVKAHSELLLTKKQEEFALNCNDQSFLLPFLFMLISLNQTGAPWYC